MVCLPQECAGGYGGFSAAKEIGHDGVIDLPMNLESATGYNIIETDSLAEAEKFAADCPFITSIRVYELRSM